MAVVTGVVDGRGCAVETEELFKTSKAMTMTRAMVTRAAPMPCVRRERRTIRGGPVRAGMPRWPGDAGVADLMSLGRTGCPGVPAGCSAWAWTAAACSLASLPAVA